MLCSQNLLKVAVRSIIPPDKRDTGAFSLSKSTADGITWTSGTKALYFRSDCLFRSPAENVQLEKRIKGSSSPKHHICPKEYTKKRVISGRNQKMRKVTI